MAKYNYAVAHMEFENLPPKLGIFALHLRVSLPKIQQQQ